MHRIAAQPHSRPIGVHRIMSRHHKMQDGWIKLRDLYRLRAATISPCTVRTENTPKVRSSATLGEEPEIEVALL